MNSSLRTWLEGASAVQHKNSNSDVHIDVLNIEYKPVSKWITGAVGLLQEATEYANSIGLEGVLSAAFALDSAEDFLGVDYDSCAQLEGQFGLTPPSLYHFPESQVPWNESEAGFQAVMVSDFPMDLATWTLLHLEYREENEPEYRRSFWVVPRAAWKHP